jgi:hypothetical protein
VNDGPQSDHTVLSAIAVHLQPAALLIRQSGHGGPCGCVLSSASSSPTPTAQNKQAPIAKSADCRLAGSC